MSSKNMAKLADVVKALAEHPLLGSLSLVQLVEYLTRVSALKRSILLAKHSAEPTDEPPDTLPRLIQRFIAESIGMNMVAVSVAWPILKAYAWTMPTVSGWVEKEKMAFSAHGWNKGLSKHVLIFPEARLMCMLAGVTLFPPSDCCLNETCEERNKELKTMESWKVVIYTIDGAYPGHSVHLICACESWF